MVSTEIIKNWGGKMGGGGQKIILGGICPPPSGAATGQYCATRSSTEGEYVALSHATQEVVWLRRLLNDIGEKHDQPSVMNGDNQGAIELSMNPRFHNRTKHIDVAYHSIREKVNDKSINEKYVRSDVSWCYDK